LTEWTLDIYKGVTLVTFKPGTPIKPDLLRAVYDSLNSDPTKYRTCNVVWDVRGVLLAEKLGFEPIFKLVDYFTENREDWWTHDRTAFVVDKKAVAGLIRIFDALKDQKLPYEVKVFWDDLEAAVAWANKTIEIEAK
jgi:hypothetical protein